MANTVQTNRRRQNRIAAVLPVKVRGIDATGAPFDEMAHTLDLAPTGARLGAIRHPLKVLDTLTVFYRQRRIEFTVVWTKLLDGKSEYQVGLQAFTHEKEAWGMSFLTGEQPGIKASAAVHGTV
ncbi:MAG: PilZ domain-containing protein [Candidatus Sulfotelmatobacter sp.]